MRDYIALDHSNSHAKFWGIRVLNLLKISVLTINTGMPMNEYVKKLQAINPGKLYTPVYISCEVTVSLSIITKFKMFVSHP